VFFIVFSLRTAKWVSVCLCIVSLAVDRTKLFLQPFHTMNLYFMAALHSRCGHYIFAL